MQISWMVSRGVIHRRESLLGVTLLRSLVEDFPGGVHWNWSAVGYTLKVTPGQGTLDSFTWRGSDVGPPSIGFCFAVPLREALVFSSAGIRLKGFLCKESPRGGTRGTPVGRPTEGSTERVLWSC
jgi:hypothetical protein